MKVKLLLLLFLPLYLFASNDPDADIRYDIFERVLNFLLFFGILFYFAAKPIKQMYFDRINSISTRLHNIQEKLKASKAKKDDAIKRVEEAKINAASLIETSKKEAVILGEKIKKDTQNELLSLQKSFESSCEFEERRMVKQVVKDVLAQMFEGSGSKVDQKELVNIILKKVS